MEKFFDSHLHATLKHHFASETKEVSAWDTLTNKDYSTNFSGFMGKMTLFFLKNFIEGTLRSQSSLTQLVQSHYDLCMMSLYSPDKDLLKALYEHPDFRKIIDKVWFGKILSGERLESLIATDNHFKILLEDLDLLQEKNSAGKVNFLSTQDSFDASPQTLNLVFAVEGLHCLRSDTNLTDSASVLADVQASIQVIQSKGAKIISSTITHIDNENQLFANQAYAMDGMRAMGLDDVPLRPTGNGFRPLGIRAIHLLEQEKICTDIKHLSFQARKDLYAHRKSNAIHSPILCTHAGLAGIPFEGAPNSFQNHIIDAQLVKSQIHSNNTNTSVQHVQVTLAKPIASKNGVFGTVGFNCASINLYDEDVKEIYNSNGLLGISLDARILGYVSLFGLHNHNQLLPYVKSFAHRGHQYTLITDTEFFSEQEFARLGLRAQRADSWFDNCVNYQNLHPIIGGKGTAGHYTQFLHFMATILHAARLAQEWEGSAGVEKMLMQILCIGSDFDGLIDSIRYATDATRIDFLKKRFEKDFKSSAKRFGISLPKSLTSKLIADQIFHHNGKNFVLSRLS
ncbi:MAG: hypothetical protein ACXIUD_16205 [Mongoliitalea sp.]